MKLDLALRRLLYQCLDFVGSEGAVAGEEDVGDRPARNVSMSYERESVGR